ncbi:MAG: DUF547 domain-containing protein [Rhodospirillaceae bacterium]
MRPSAIARSAQERLPLNRLALVTLVLALVSLWAALLPGMAWAAPKAEAWERWRAHTPGSTLTVDNSAWAAFISKYLVLGADGVARLPYGQVSGEDYSALVGYVRALEAVNPDSLDRPEQMAYWFNFYNALTVRVVLDAWRQDGPVDSIRDIDISPGLFANGPWGAKLVTVNGIELSLDDMEHRILRPLWRDPRIHYGVNCASIGCPNLLPEPLSGATVDQQLTEAAIAYVNHPRGVTMTNGGPVVSTIYRWFREDFGDSEAGVLNHLRQYAAPALLQQLQGVSDLAGHAYDWDLNAP